MNDPTHQNSSPLITKMNRPSVRIVTGNVNSTRIGRISALIRPSTSAAISAVQNVSTVTHGNTYGSAKSATELMSQTSSSRIEVPPVSYGADPPMNGLSAA